MLSRGYQGTFRTFSHPHFKRADYFTLIAGALVLSAILIGSRLS
jgi:hypothetical protein